MLRIRFIKKGKRNQPFFRIVVTDKKNPPQAGRFLEILGYYNPHTKEKSLKSERIKYWISVGAQPSDRVHNLLVSEKVIDSKKRPVHKEAPPKEEPEEKKEEQKETKEEKPEEKNVEETKEESKEEEKKEEQKEENKEEDKEEKKE